MIKVKICGITNAADAKAAVDAGADYIGFVFAPSPRQASPDEVKKIVESIPLSVSTVGVFVDEDRERVEKIVADCRLSYVQFHGEEPPELCNDFGSRAIKAVRVRDELSLAGLEDYRVAAFLLDSYASDKAGGTGKTFSWDIAVKAKTLGKPIILSGGLNKDNVTDAITTVRPYAVDVSSGVESSPGRKDHKLLTEFIHLAKSTGR